MFCFRPSTTCWVKDFISLFMEHTRKSLNNAKNTLVFALLAGCATSSTELDAQPSQAPLLEEKIGDGIHCTDAIDDINASEEMKALLKEDARMLQRSLLLEERRRMAASLCPNHAGVGVDDQGNVYVLEVVGGMRRRIDPFLHAVLEISGYAKRIQRSFKSQPISPQVIVRTTPAPLPLHTSPKAPTLTQTHSMLKSAFLFPPAPRSPHS